MTIDVQASPRDTIRRVFKFLVELERIRKKPPATLSVHPWHLDLATLPVHPALRVEMGDDEEGVGFRMEVRQPRIKPCPLPPPEVREILAPGWNDPLGLDRLLPDEERGWVAPGVLDAHRRWSEVRAAWCDEVRAAARTRQLFESLYEKVWTPIERESEAFEFLLTDGLFVGADRKGQPVRHPILAQPLEVFFDSDRGVLEVTETTSSARLLTPLLRSLPGVDGRRIQQAVAMLREDPPALHVREEVVEILPRLLNKLFPVTGLYSDLPLPPSALIRDDQVTLSPSPHLVLAKKSPGFEEAIKRFLVGLDDLEIVPQGLLRVVGSFADDGASAAGAEATHRGVPGQGDFDPVLTKEANADQVEILRRLDQHGTVLVQGPPGTGKTHTIANLLGHLLAHGKSVLVTSHAAKALRVVRQHVVEELRPLCVSVLDSDRGSRHQLEGAVNSIVEHFNRQDAAALRSSVKKLERRRTKLRKTVSTLRADLKDACAREQAKLVVAGKSRSPLEAGRWLAQHKADHGWIPGEVKAEQPPPLSQAELEALYATNSELPAEQEEAFRIGLPDPASFPPADKLETAWRVLDELTELDTDWGAEFWSGDTPGAAALSKLVERTQAVVRELEPLAGWAHGVVEAGLAGGSVRAPWVDLISSVESIAEQAKSTMPIVVDFAPESHLDWPLDEQLVVARELETEFSAGKRPSGLRLLWRPRWKQWLAGVLVNDHPVQTAAELEAATAVLELEKARQDLATRWSRLAPTVGGPELGSDSSSAPEGDLQPHVWTVRKALGWVDDGWHDLLAQLEDAGLDWNTVLDQIPPEPVPMPHLHRVTQSMRGALYNAVETRRRAQLQTELSAWLGVQAPRVVTLCHGADPSGVLGLILEAIESKDAAAYQSAVSRLMWLAEREVVAQRRHDLLDRLGAAAPRWAAAIRHRRAGHGADAAPGDIGPAWTWAQWSSALERHLALDPDVLQRQLTEAAADLRLVEREYAASLAWLAQKLRTTDIQMQSLTGWVDTVRKIGKGTGKRAPRLKREARTLLDGCRNAVPAWVMPMSRVVETYDLAETQFDVVIVDEASQLDVLGLVAFALGRQVVVVGDNEQVSPAAVGQDQDRVQALIDQYLGGVPNAHLYDGKTSVYDLARQSFGGRIRLREHFRCARPIIEFSNQLCYEGQITPLRDTSRSRLKPHIVSERVQGHRERKTNPPEALAAASLLVAMTRQPEYADCSMGVVSMLGTEQGLEIERLITKHMPLGEISRRRIVCGTSAQFQGDERDVMLMSLVAEPPEQGVHSKLDQDWYKQRLNVAASRARDQLWVVHSVDVDHFQTVDLRGRFLKYIEDPEGAIEGMGRMEAQADSPFEIAVGRRLINAGYRVEPQFPVGAFRIDLVVTGPSGARAAIECDGDRFHGPERLQDDLERQAILERMGWRFVRIRGGAFYRDPDSEMERVVARLSELDVEPGGAEAPETPADELVERVRGLAAELRAEWASADDQPEDAADEQQDQSGWEDAPGAGERVLPPRPDASQAPSRHAFAARSSRTSARGRSLQRAEREGRVLAAVDEEWRSRSELLERADIEEKHWIRTIQALMDQGRVERRGQKRGTRYRRRSETAPSPAPAGPGRPHLQRPGPPRPLVLQPPGNEELKQPNPPSPGPPPGASGQATPPLDQEPRRIPSPTKHSPAGSSAFGSRPGGRLSAALVAHDPRLAGEQCVACEGTTRLHIGRYGPFIRCRAAGCGTRWAVPLVELTRFVDHQDHFFCADCAGRLQVLYRDGSTVLKCRHCGLVEGWQALEARMERTDPNRSGDSR